MRYLTAILGVAVLATALTGAQQAPDHMAIKPPKDLEEAKVRIAKLDELTRQQTKTIGLLMDAAAAARSEMAMVKEAQKGLDEGLKAAQKEIQELKSKLSQ